MSVARKHKGYVRDCDSDHGFFILFFGDPNSFPARTVIDDKNDSPPEIAEQNATLLISTWT